MSVAFMQSLEKFQADNLAPIMTSDKKSNLYYVLNKEYWFSDIMKQRGVGAPAIRQGYGVSQRSFLCDLWAVGKDIDDQVRANEDTPLNSDRTAAKFVTRAALMQREKSFKNAFWGTGKWTTDLTGNSSASAITGSSTFRQWDHASATPIDDVEEMKTIMEKLTGYTPNVLAIGQPVWRALKKCQQIIDRITGGSTSVNPAKVTRQLVAQLFEIEDLVVLGAVENTAGHGNTMVGDYIFKDQGLLMYRDATVGIETPTACRTITWQQYAGNKNGTRILKWRDESVHSDIIEIESTYVHHIVAADMGIFLTDMMSTV
jgi:hypothetical protein